MVRRRVDGAPSARWTRAGSVARADRRLPEGDIEGHEDEAKSKYEEAITIFKELGREKDIASIKKELG